MVKPDKVEIIFPAHQFKIDLDIWAKYHPDNYQDSSNLDLSALLIRHTPLSVD